MGRTTREQLRGLLIDAGVALLREDGLQGGAERVTLPAVFSRVEQTTGRRVAKGQVYGRIWESQSAFQTDVLVSAARGYAGAESGPAVAAVGAVLAEADLSTQEGRESAMWRVCDEAGRAYVDALVASREWLIWLGVWAHAASGDDSSESVGPLVAAIHDGYQAANGVFVDLYRALLETFHLELRPGLTIEQFATAAGALANGLALRARFNPNDVQIGTADGAVPLMALCLRALVVEFTLPAGR